MLAGVRPQAKPTSAEFRFIFPVNVACRSARVVVAVAYMTSPFKTYQEEIAFGEPRYRFFGLPLALTAILSQSQYRFFHKYKTLTVLSRGNFSGVVAFLSRYFVCTTYALLPRGYTLIFALGLLVFIVNYFVNYNKILTSLYYYLHKTLLIITIHFCRVQISSIGAIFHFGVSVFLNQAASLPYCPYNKCAICNGRASGHSVFHTKGLDHQGNYSRRKKPDISGFFIYCCKR